MFCWRLPLEIKELFTEWLEQHFPDRASRVLSLVRQTRGGALYRSSWGERQRGTGPYADLIAQRVKKTKRRPGLDEAVRADWLDCSQFKAPLATGDQLSLL
jgi:DNA repair photolyase